MLNPYADSVEGRDDEASRYGILRLDPTLLNEQVKKFDEEGLTVKFHAAGDAAVRAALDSIEYAQQQNGKGPQMHNVAHCTFVSEEDIERAAQLGATLEVSPYLWQPVPICSDIAHAVGDEVIKRVWPIREMLDGGVLVVPGSDWSVVPSVNPWVGIETMITRQLPGGSAESFGPTQAVTIEEALKIFTENSARQEGLADIIGRIDVGMIADLIVIDKNPYEISPFEIHKINVNKTIIEGEIVYENK
jgi:predicted amidohydrolase YtcJ